MFFAYLDPLPGYVPGSSGSLAYLLAACAAACGVVALRLEQVYGFFTRRLQTIPVETGSERKK